MKTANIINQINAGVHILLENTKQNIIIDLVEYYQKDIPFDKAMEIVEIVEKRFTESHSSVDEE